MSFMPSTYNGKATPNANSTKNGTRRQGLLRLPFPTPSPSPTPASRPAFEADEVTPVVYGHINFSMRQLNDALTIVPDSDASLEDMNDISDVARPPCTTQKGVDQVFGALQGRLQGLLQRHEAIALFGLVTPPLRAKFVEENELQDPTNVYLFESFNRRDENGNFRHLSWKLTGRYSL